MNDIMTNEIIMKIVKFLLSLIAFFFSISCHEFAHGYVAYKLGDPTAKNAGRLTLNPIKHFDLFSILFFAIFHFGWAKGVPIDSRYFKDPKKGIVFTSLAGPLTNVLLAFLSLIIMKFITVSTVNLAAIICYNFFYYMASVNTMLAIFNLLPIPPLDGSKVFYSILPQRIYYKIMSYDRYMMIVTMILIFTGVLNKIVTTGSYNLEMWLKKLVDFIFV